MILVAGMGEEIRVNALKPRFMMEQDVNALTLPSKPAYILHSVEF
jgi:hypothetical protein